MPADSVDLIVTSPPFALLREKSYGNLEQSEYVDWLCDFGRLAHRVLKPTGSFVLDLGGAYQRGRPIRSIYNFRVLIRFVDELGYYLAEDFYWHNPSKLPSPIEWVNKRKIRVKDSVNTIWWFSKTEYPQADVTKVLAPYSERMKKLLRDPEAYYSPKGRPSGHSIGGAFGKDNGGAIPPNLLTFPNSESNSIYLRLCKILDIAPHPARFPREIPEFFVKFLTKPGDYVVDIFGGSATTGEVAESLSRRWLCVEIDPDYTRASAVRFLEDRSQGEIIEILKRIKAGESPQIRPKQLQLLPDGS
jgi:site-specific DNA-methyltransferase (cytosine-N4-specific)